LSNAFIVDSFGVEAQRTCCGTTSSSLHVDARQAHGERSHTPPSCELCL
jgi:hypothetical protein